MCGTMVHVMVLYANKVESNTGKGLKKKPQKYHEAVDRAVAEAIPTPFGGTHTPTMCMLASVASVLYKTHRKWGKSKELE